MAMSSPLRLLSAMFTAAVSVGLLFPASGAMAAPPETPLGRKIENFTLNDFRGKSHSLADFKKSKLVVVAFLGTECPLAKLYTPRLVRLAEKYGKQGVAFVGVNANSQDSVTEMAAHVRDHAVTFPMLKDLGNRVADQMGAVRTPEVFLLDEQRRVRYWGRIDDQYGIGYIRDEPKRHELQIAIDELLAGKKVSRPVAEAVGCFIGRVQKPKANSPVTYSKQIAPLLQKRCAQCHRKGEIAPFALTQYDEVVGWAETIAEVVREERMPPWHADPRYGEFADDRRMSDEEKKLIYQWVDYGAPEGDPKQLPPPRQFVTGWQLPQEPDLVIPMSKEPYRVQAEGVVRYQNFSVDTGFKEDKWVTMLEAQPGNRAVVHHILVALRNGPGSRLRIEDRFLVAYVPGLRAKPFPDGMAKRIPAGSKLIFQLHYTPIGTEQLDISRVGMVFADPKEVTHQVMTRQAANSKFAIPPHAENHPVEAASRAADRDMLLLSMMPHMHLRGKSFRYEARYADGRTERLLDVPAYDFNWQTSYRLAAPKLLPKGTRIQCLAHFDNSEFNLANPAPEKTIRWGDQTWDEMMIGYFDVAVPREPVKGEEDDAKKPDKEKEDKAGLARRIQEKAKALLRRYDKNNDGEISKDEVPERLLPTFQRLDKNKNDRVTLTELLPLVKQQIEKP